MTQTRFGGSAIAKILLWGFAGLMLVVLLLWGTCRWQAAGELQSEIEAVRDAGYPITLEELRDWHPEPDPDEGPHAGDVYKQAFSLLLRDYPMGEDGQPAPLLGEASVPLRGSPWPAELTEKVRAALDDHAEVLEVLHEAAQMGPAWFDMDYDNDLRDAYESVFIPTAISLRLLQLESLWHIKHGRTDASVDSILALLGTSEAFADVPADRYQGLRSRGLRMASDAAEHLLLLTEPSEDQMRRLQEAVAATDDGGRGLVRAIAGNRVLNHALFERVKRGDGGARDPGINLAPLRATGWLDHEHARYLRELGEDVRIAEEYTRGNVSKTEDISDYAPPWLSHFMDFFTTPPMGQALAWSELRVDAERMVTVVGLAAARYELEHGEPPAALDDLVPDYIDAVPEDPYEPGEPLKYRIAESGVIVYSVANFWGEDHDGRELSDRGSRVRGNHGTDITFTLGDAQAELWPEQWPDSQLRNAPQ